MAPDSPGVDDIFLAAIEKRPEDRSAFLDEVCGKDSDLRGRVERLLATQSKVGSFLETPAEELVATTYFAISEQIGDMVGPYKLLQRIGVGGMGVVYMAEQSEPVERRVALKIVKPGMDTRQVIARFEAERQALAMMDHPNIAKVLDAGSTDTERPYFVMELVKGVPITEYCDHNRLTPRQRLALLVPICHAVQHAHQKGIIHRDIKPSNTLIAEYDDRPVPKIIDFGVAKAIERRLTEKTMFTEFGQVLGTVEYMSPEQAKLNQLDIDIRTDIYSLGVLLYELLVGTTPFDRERLRTAAIEELLRIIREEEPPRPSLRLSTSKSLPTIAARRHTEPAQLSALIRGELDWIAMKALEKDRTRRYETAIDFARDIQRYLDDDPVEACPPSAGYRLRKFARKHRVLLATVAAFTVVLLTGVVVSTWQAVRATRAEAQALMSEEQALKNEVKARASADAERSAKEAELKQRRVAEARELSAKRYLYVADLQLARQAWDANNPSRVLELLSQLRPEANEIDLRGFEWYYLNRLCHAAKAIQRDHENEVYCVCYSPDGKLIASTGTFDTTIRVRDSVTGTTQRVLEGHTDVVYQAAFAPDCRTLLSCSKDKTVRVWDLETGTVRASIETGIIPIGMSLSPDGDNVAVGGPKHIEVWAIDAAEKVFEADSGPGRLGRFAVSPAVAFGPGGKLLAFTTFREIDGTLVAGVQLWDLQTNEGKGFLQGHDKAVTSLAIAPDGLTLVSGSTDHTAKVWDLGEDKLRVTLTGHDLEVRGVAISPDGTRIATASHDKTIRIWDARSGNQLQLFRGHINAVNSVAFQPTGQELVSGSKDGTVRIWDYGTPIEVRRFQADKKWHIRRLTFLDNATLVTGSSGGDVVAWNATTDRHQRRFDGVRGVVMSVGYIPGVWGTLVACGLGSSKIVVWNAETGEPQAPIDLEARGMQFAISPDGTKAAIIDLRGRVSLVDFATSEQAFMEGGHDGPVYSVAWRPDGKQVATGSLDKTIRIWDIQTRSQIHKLSGHTMSVPALAFNSDGSILASGSASATEMDQRREPATPGTIRLWDMTQDVPTSRILSGHTGGVMSLTFSPDDRTLVSASHDETVRCWDPVTGTQTMTLPGNSGYFWSVAFSPDGTKLAAGADKGVVYMWNTAPTIIGQTE